METTHLNTPHTHDTTLAMFEGRKIMLEGYEILLEGQTFRPFKHRLLTHLAHTQHITQSHDVRRAKIPTLRTYFPAFRAYFPTLPAYFHALRT